MNLKKYEVADPGLLDHILNNITSAVFLINENAEIQAYNKTFEKLFKAERREIIGAMFGDIVHCHYTDGKSACGILKECQLCEVRNSIKKTIGLQEPLDNHVFPHEFWDNKVLVKKYFKISTRSINYEGIKLVLVIMDDITELEMQKLQQQEQNQKLQELNQIKNRFLGIAAHDLRNPIAAIQGCITILNHIHENGSKGEVEEILGIMREKSQFALDLIHDLLDVAKIESGHQDYVFEEHDYEELLVTSAKSYKMMADSKNLDLTWDINLLPKFKFDKNKIEQALNNLIDNAIKYSLDGTKISVQAYEENGFVVTKVTDQGFGIPYQDFENIFKPFHKGNVEAHPKQQSTGLGLAIVKKIIEGHKGKIWVESEVGRGSVFTFLLPK